MNKYPTLFSPINVGGVELRSRCIMSGMVSNMSNPDGSVSDKLIAYHVERAKNGVGLQFVGASYVEKAAQAYAFQTAIDRDELIPGLKKLTDAVHAEGGKIGIQLWHGGRESNPMFSQAHPVAPSPLPGMSGIVPHVLTVEEIQSIVKKFAEAAERAKKAGFDIVLLHGSHGYLIQQFLSPFTNKREDEYGGSLENRNRIAVEIACAIRELCGPEFPIGFRLSGDEYMGPMGTSIDDCIVLANSLIDKAGVCLIDISGGNATEPISIGDSGKPEGMFVEDAAKVKAAIGNKAMVSVANRIKRPELIEEILSSGKTDLVTTGRALICDPEFYTKAKEGREDEIRVCASCNHCFASMMDANYITCLQNPLTGREDEYDLSKKTDASKKVVVVGGGAAGMEAAYIAALRGHDVTLLEGASALGGKVHVADKPPLKFELENVVTYLSGVLNRVGVKVKLNTKANLDTILAEKPDSVILATGACPAKPPIKGLDGKNVCVAQDLLLGKAEAKGKTVIIGGGAVGVETAEHLLNQGNEVIIVEMQEKLMSDLYFMQYMSYVPRVLLRLRSFATNTKVLEIDGSNVVTDQGTYTDVDSVVLAAGYRPVNGLATELEQAGIPCTVIGDANQPARIPQATFSGLKAAYEI